MVDTTSIYFESSGGKEDSSDWSYKLTIYKNNSFKLLF